MADIFKYLGLRLDRHCRDHIEDTMNIYEGPEFEEELESYKNLMNMVLYREQNDLEVAHSMEIPRKALYRFGYTNESIKEEWERIGMDGDYPY